MQVSTSRYTPQAGWSEALPTRFDSARTLVLAFGASTFVDDDQPFADLRAAFPTSHIIGCSTAGEIAGTSVDDGTVVVAIVRFEKTALAIATQEIDLRSSFEAGEALSRSLAGADLRGVFVLGVGHDINGSRLTEGMQSVLGAVPISGGLAGDGKRFARTWVLAGGHVRQNVVTAIGFYGDAIRLGHGCKGGWDKFGPERRITRSDGNVLYELDGRPALGLYKDYLGELAAGLPATALLYPLAIRPNRQSSEQLVRTVLQHAEDEQSLTFAGDMPEGALAQLMRANFDRLTLAAGGAASDARLEVGTPSLCVAISCVGRRLVLGERAEEETEAVADVLPSSCHVVGFYSYGEISPRGVGSCNLHNQTMTLTTIAEE
jgi:hypothetical protein